MEMREFTLDLEDYRTPQSKVFVGRPRGLQVRNESRIDTLENNYDKINVIVPATVSSINPSFLEEFLVNVVTKLGKEKFYKKFTFTSKGRYQVDTDLDEAIDCILREENALA